MLDFSHVEFDKQISLAPKAKAYQIESKWPLSRLSDLVEIISGGTPDTANETYWGGDIPWLSVTDFSSVSRFVYAAEKSITQEGLRNSSTKILQIGDLIISARGTVGALAQLGKPMAFNQSCYGLRSKGSMSNDCLFYVLSKEIMQLKAQATGSKFDAITTRIFDEVKIPVPPPDVQAQIVAECQAIDAEVEQAKEIIQKEKDRVAYLVQQSLLGPENKTLSNIALDIFAGGDKPEDFSLTPTSTHKVPVYSNGVTDRGLFGYTVKADERITGPSVTVSARGTIGVAFARNEAYFPIVRLIVIITDEKIVQHRFLELAINYSQILKSGSVIPQLTVPDISDIEIPIPTIAAQEQVLMKVDTHEAQIQSARTVIASSPERRQTVLERYL